MRYLILILLLLGCSDRRRYAPGDIVAPGVKIVGYDGSNKDRREQREATIAHVDSFTVITGFGIPVTNLLILKDTQDVFDVCNYQGASGCVVDYYKYPPTRVACWAGRKNEVPALGHEKVHLVIGDPTHSDPRWYVWDVKFNETSALIRRQRQ